MFDSYDLIIAGHWYGRSSRLAPAEFSSNQREFSFSSERCCGMEEGFTVNLLIPSCVHLFPEEGGRDAVDDEEHRALIDVAILTRAGSITGSETTIRHAIKMAFDQEFPSTAFHDIAASESLF